MFNQFMLDFYLVAVKSGRIPLPLVQQPYRDLVQKRLEEEEDPVPTE